MKSFFIGHLGNTHSFEDEKMGSVPTREAFLEKIEQFKQDSGHDSAYLLPKKIIDENWKKDHDLVSDAVIVFLIIWNNPLYRFGFPDYNKIVNYIKCNCEEIDKYRKRNIFTLRQEDKPSIFDLFNKALEATSIDKQVRGGKITKVTSSVSVAKMLHILAPDFFVPWDKKIANEYNCNYEESPDEKFFKFCLIMKEFAEKIREYDIGRSDLAKAMDEYNYMTYE